MATAGSKKTPKSYPEKYPVLETIGTIPIRKVNYVSVYINEANMRIIAKAILKMPTMSVAKILALSGKPSDCCKSKKVMVAYGDKIVLIPRGLLSSKRDTNGSNIAKKKRNGK